MQELASNAPFIDESLIVPLTVGETLETTTRVLGALAQSALADVETSHADALRKARRALLEAVEKDDAAAVGSTLGHAQRALAELYEAVKTNAQICGALDFPTPEFLSDPMNVGIVDVEKIVVTFTLEGKQMLTSLAFPHAANANFYWLHEVRYFAENPDERVEDPILQSRLPIFDRVRLAPGKRILRIKTRNASGRAITEEFTLEVPQP